MKVLPRLLAYLGPALLAIGASRGGVWTFLPVAFIFGLLPILDDRVGHTSVNPPSAPAGSRWPSDLPLCFFVPVQTAAISTLARDQGFARDVVELGGAVAPSVAVPHRGLVQSPLKRSLEGKSGAAET